MPLYTRIKGNTEYETIGSPTIIDGVASNFSLVDYYKLNAKFLPGNSTWKFQTKIKFDYPGSDIRFAIYNETYKDWRSPKFEIQTTSSSKIKFKFGLSANGTSWNINNTYVSINYDYTSWYYFLCEFTGTEYVISYKKEGDSDFTVARTVTNSNHIYQDFSCTGLSFGCDMSSGSEWESYFPGQIDFNETCISIDDIMWFGKGFGRVKIRTSPFVTYNVVGNPTITDGIMSNFSVSKYAQIPMPNFSTSNSWEIVCKAKVNSLTTGYQIFYTSSANNPAIGLDIDKDGKLAAAIGNAAGSGWLITETGSWEGTKKTITLDTFFWTKLTFNGSRYTIYYSDDGITWEETIYYNSTSKISYDPSYNFNFGVSRNANAFVLKGEIDFKETYIKIDDEYYFKGKYKNETWKLRTLNSD